LNKLARFSVLTRPALAFVIDPLKALNNSSPFVVLVLFADVVYHPFQIPRGETNHAIASLPNDASVVKEAR
jgi:hypothetical protein